MKKEMLLKNKTGKKRNIRIIAVKKKGTLELACGDTEILYKHEPLCCVRVEANTGVIIERSGDYDRIKITLVSDKPSKGRAKTSQKKRSKSKIFVSVPKKWSIKNSGHKGTVSKAT